jgi:hypothetical protein
LRARQHRRAQIDPDDGGPGRIEREVAAGADAGVEDAAGEPAKHLRPDPAIAPDLARELVQIISPGDVLIDEIRQRQQPSLRRRHLL